MGREESRHAVARERGTTVLTIGDVERLGIERAAEAALEVASKDTEAIDHISTRLPLDPRLLATMVAEGKIGRRTA
jgi:hypothetical protein